MKKVIVLVCFVVLLFAGCMSKGNSGTTGGSNSTGRNPVIEGIVKSINLKDGNITSILIADNKNSEYVFAINEKVDFKEQKNLKPGSRVKIEHSGEIRESYPAQGTAKKISILGDKTVEVVDPKLYAVLPIRAQYNDALHKNITNSLGILSVVIDSKEKFDSYMNQINFDSENKINLRSKYDNTFFQTRKLILLIKFTSSTPSYSIGTINRSGGVLNVQVAEKTSEIQTEDILVKGFLIEADNIIMKDSNSVNILYTREVTTK